MSLNRCLASLWTKKMRPVSTNKSERNEMFDSYTGLCSVCRSLVAANWYSRVRWTRQLHSTPHVSRTLLRSSDLWKIPSGIQRCLRQKLSRFSYLQRCGPRKLVWFSIPSDVSTDLLIFAITVCKSTDSEFSKTSSTWLMTSRISDFNSAVIWVVTSLTYAWISSESLQLLKEVLRLK